MADILPFKKPVAPPNTRGNTLCRNGHHKWIIVTKQQFDVKQGKLITVSQCQRCAKRKVETL
ncbi:MAG: hypothetical protein JKY66_05735 [Spongiibacteraceae bacterium]|nr:hypothetical protein [Spongiibacteraceae bacterium]